LRLPRIQKRRHPINQLLPGVSAFRYYRFRLFLSVWQSLRFRYLALWTATYPKASALLAFACLLAIFYRRVEGWMGSIRQMIYSNPPWNSLSKAAAGLFLVGLFVWALSVRKRIFVASFEDYSGDSSLKDFVAGLPPMLLNELSRIRKLHEDVTESGAYSSASETIAASISVQNVGDTLQSAISKDSKMKLGFLEIPIGAALGVFGRIVQGPKVSGSVHQQENVTTLIARIEGGGFPSTDWRVDSTDLFPRNPADATPMLTRLVEQLAYRIFTDLVPTGSTRWEAVYAFSQGLKLLRVTTRTDTDKPWNLRQAEARFIEAVAKDNKFGSCRYNLGVVYERLDQPDSAKQAYATAIQEKPEFAPSYYASALIRLNSAAPGDLELYRECIRFCDEAIALNLDYARAWSLKGLAYRRMRAANLPREEDAGSDVFKESNRSRGVAAAVAWRAVCKSTLAGRPDKSAYAKGIAVNCLRNLAVGHAMLNHGKAKTLFAQALSLKPADADLHFEFGKTLCRLNKHPAAVREFTAAVTLGGRPPHWAWLAAAQHKTNAGHADVRESLRRALQGSRAGDKSREEIDKSYRALAPGKLEPGFVTKVDEAQTIASELGLKIELNELPYDYLERIEKMLLEKRKGWDFSDVIAIMQDRIADEELKKLVGSAADQLVTDSGLYGWLAYGYLDPRRKESEAALPHAERAVIRNPLRSWERSALGQAYSALGDTSARKRSGIPAWTLRPPLRTFGRTLRGHIGAAVCISCNRSEEGRCSSVSSKTSEGC
jgi:tetratricopeptide (TPR) repeat protein